MEKSSKPVERKQRRRKFARVPATRNAIRSATGTGIRQRPRRPRPGQARRQPNSAPMNNIAPRTQRNNNGMSGSRRMPNAAMAVLRRARETAAAAAEAAADAAAMIEQTRMRRQDYFDQRRGINNGGGPPHPRRQSFPIDRVGAFDNGRSQAVRSQSKPRRRRTRYSDTQRPNAPDFHTQRNRSQGYDYNPAQYVPVSDEYLQAVDYVGSEWPVPPMGMEPYYGPSAYETVEQRPRPEENRWRDRSRNAEYLAQARALIQAQNEQMQSSNGRMRSAPRRRSVAALARRDAKRFEQTQMNRW